MKTLVIDVAADYGGALTILNQYYNEFTNDCENEYVVCVSVVDNLKSTDNITIVKLPWVKKSWFHRLWFDYVYSHKLIKEYDIDNIFSLQNIIIPNTKLPQTVYLHQSLPFSEYKFKFSENKKFWIYQNVIGKLIYKSAKKASCVIVQTQWMKDALLKIDGIDESAVQVIPPQNNIFVEKYFDEVKFENNFFYPASNYAYKNHITILKAALNLKKQGIDNFKIILTLTKDNLPEDCKELYSQVKENVELVGTIFHDEVMDYYNKTVLVFPSYIETFGLPLLEARETKSPIIASDMPFSREILKGYNKANFFDAFSDSQLTAHLKKFILRKGE